jgi:hypothetical protein
MEEREIERSPYTRPGFVISAAGLGMLAMAALFVVVGAAAHKKPTQTAAMRRSKTHPGPGNPSGSVKLSCSLPVGSQQAPTVGPELAWVTVGEMQAPQAPATYGPQREQDGIAVCFAHNPTGSLLAAINFFAQATAASPVKLIRTLVANTPERVVALTQAREGQDQLLQNSDGDPGSVQVTGYEIVDYTPAQANLNVVLEGPGGQLAAVECQLEWQAHDWKFVIPPGGQLNSAAITTMDGFVSWTATSGGEG